ncbi:hypothetical protein [Streptomyces sp. NRRL S-646]|uniref:hypothetical protein n=1 Tax=Streptomyces sp. NRRL S-646 TaxID=1463917 RepID=UPI001F48AC29|nr:hypothetical protein [Streptomyces sp. NRRL S-646]
MLSARLPSPTALRVMSKTAPPSMAASRSRTSSGALCTGSPVPSKAPRTPPSTSTRADRSRYPGLPPKSQAA